MKAVTRSPPQAYKAVKEFVNGDEEKEFLLIDSKWRSYARIQTIPPASLFNDDEQTVSCSLICVDFDEVKIDSIVEAINSPRSHNLSKPPTNIYGKQPNMKTRR